LKLTYAQKRAIYENGYVIVPNVIPRIMIDEALRAINHSMGQGMNKEDIVKFSAQSYCPEIQESPVITDLMNKTPAWELAESALGEIRSKAVSGQIALRFPRLMDPPGKAGPHLDGMHSPHNGVKKGTISNFTMLVGVLLSDLPGPNAGNLTVWPGTHHQYEAYFREHGAESLLNGMPPIDMPEPVQVTGKAGDVVFCHYQLAHGVTPNVSPHIRYAVFFRLFHKDFDRERWQEPMLDIWMHWPGIREVM
jgi:hypothetical protein